MEKNQYSFPVFGVLHKMFDDFAAPLFMGFALGWPGFVPLS